MEKASKDLFDSLDKFGPDEVLDLLVVHSHKDPVARDLLIKFPIVVTFGKPLSTMPIVNVDKRTFEYLKGRGCMVS